MAPDVRGCPDCGRKALERGVTISERGRQWRGDEPADLDAYLAAYRAGGHPVQRVVHPRCGSCRTGAVFRLWLDDEAGAAVRRCTACGDEHAMLDSEPYLAEAELGAAACPCGHEEFDVAVGYSMTADGEVRWVSLGLRCRQDGQLGVYSDWKIDHEPSGHLLGAA